jgi:hypothetical protein
MGGTEAAPLITLTWVCPPQTVERFEVFVHTAIVRPPGSPPPAAATNKLFLNPAAKTSVFGALLTQLQVSDRVIVDRSFLTGKVGGDFGSGPRFTLPLEVDRGFEYTVWLRGIGPNGEIGECSRQVTCRWQAPKAAAGSIPWPERPLPAVGAFHASIHAIDLSDVPAELRADVDVDATPVGILVGAITIGDTEEFSMGSHGRLVFSAVWYSLAQGRHDPNTQLFTRASDAAPHLLPCVLYRQQVANASFPDVSGDVVQCSPLIAKIAWSRPLNVDGAEMTYAAELVDPFFRWVPWIQPGAVGRPRLLALYLVDTQPVVGGARYRYSLLRFDSRGEPVHTVPCGEVTIGEVAP